MSRGGGRGRDARVPVRVAGDSSGAGCSEEEWLEEVADVDGEGEIGR